MAGLPFYILLTVFSSYKDDGRSLMRSCAIKPYLQLEIFPPPAGLNLSTGRSVVQRLSD